MKKILIIITIAILFGGIVYLLNPIIFPLFKTKTVFPTLLIKTCPNGYSHPFSMRTGKKDNTTCKKNLKPCSSNQIWIPKKRDCTPDMVSCVFDQPCLCDNWKKDNNKWICAPQTKYFP